MIQKTAELGIIADFTDTTDIQSQCPECQQCTDCDCMQCPVDCPQVSRLA